MTFVLNQGHIANRCKYGAPNTIRTCDLPLRRRLLYPAELPGHRQSGFAL